MMYKSPRLYVEDQLLKDQTIDLSSAHMHYLRNVLRQKDGTEIRLFNGQDGEWLASFHPHRKKHGSAHILDNIRPQSTLKRRVHLLFAPIKKNRMDFMIEKAVELGATDLHPILTQNTQTRHINEERTKAQIIEAAQQCERLTLPILHTSTPLDKKCTTWDTHIPLLVGLERHICPPLSSYTHDKRDRDIAFLVGPEGGFTQTEKKNLLSYKSVTPVTLGESILRAETASLYALSLFLS